MKIILSFFAYLSVLVWMISCRQADQSVVKIINGRPVEATSPAYSSAVRLDLGGGLCTGSVVASRIILTAAHCLENVAPEAITVTFDKVPNGNPFRFGKVVRAQSFKEFGAQRFPNFDVAYLELEQDVPSPYAPMEILRDPSALTSDTQILLAGFGNQSDRCQTENCVGKLLETNTKFQKYYDKAHIMSLLVFHGPPTEGFGGACNGDSGGPAYAKVGAKWFLIGVTNGLRSDIVPDSDGTCASGWDIYTFAGDYTAWLESENKLSLKREANGNPSPRIIPQLIAGLDQILKPSSWAGWVSYANHEDPSWYTVDTILQNMIRNLAHSSGRYPSYATEMLFDGARTERIAEAMESVYLTSPSVGDLSPLQSFVSLRQVFLDQTSVKDLTPLSGVKDLDYLKIRNVPGDAGQDYFNSLGSARRTLKTLDVESVDADLVNVIDWNEFQKISAVSLAKVDGIMNLSRLNPRSASAMTLALQGADIEGVLDGTRMLNPVLRLSSLHDIDGRSLDEWVRWSSFPEMQALDLKGFESQAIPLLKDFAKLKAISLVSNKLTSLAGLSLPDKLESLDVSGNALTSLDLSARGVRSLRSYDNPLLDQSCPAANCLRDVHILPRTFLHYCENAVAALSDQFTHSYYSTLQGIQVQNGGPSRLSCDILAQITPRLRYLALNNSGIRDVRPLAFLSDVQYLMLDNNELEDMTPLLAMGRLEYLSLAGNQLREIPRLSRLTQLTELNLAYNPLQSLTLDAPELRRVVFGRDNSPRAYRPFALKLSEATNLESLDLGGVALDATSQLDLQKVFSLQSLNFLDGQITSANEFSSMLNLQLVSPRLDLEEGCSIVNGSCVQGPLDIRAKGVLGPMLGTLSGERKETKSSSLFLPGWSR